jgi:hypothetical protein
MRKEEKIIRVKKLSEGCIVDSTGKKMALPNHNKSASLLIAYVDEETFYKLQKKSTQRAPGSAED